MKKTKKLTCFILVALITAGTFVGCTNGGDKSSSNSGSTATDSSTSGDSSKEEKPEKTETISVMLFDRGNAPQGEGTADNNRWTKWLNEQMLEQGVQMKFILVPRSEEGQKVPVMMASQTAADIMLLYNSTLVQQWYREGGLHTLNDSIDKYGKDLVDYVTPEIIDMGKSKEGDIYTIFARRAITANTNAFIRKDWLETLGMEVPTTPDELYNVLKAFKEKDPGKVGKDKVVAYSGGNALEKAFINIKDPIEYTINNVGGMSGFVYTDPKFKEYYVFANKLYNEGLRDLEYFTSKLSQKEKEQFVAGTLGYWETDVGSNVDTLRGALLQNLRKNIPDADMVSMPMLENVNDGNRYVNEYPATGANVFIPKTAKNVDACIKYLNFLAGEGGKTVYFGLEDTNYKMEDGYPVPIDVDLNATQLDWVKHDLFLVGNQGYFKSEEDFIQTTAKMFPGYEQYIIDDYRDALDGVRLTHSNYSSETQIKQGANIQKVYDDYGVKITTAKPSEVDALYEEFKAQLKKYEIEKVLQERREYYESLAK